MNKRVKKAKPPIRVELKREPTAGERKGIEAAKAFCCDRADPVSFKIDSADGTILNASILHNDRAGFEVQRRATFGTTSYDLSTHMTARLGMLVCAPGHEMPTETELNTGIAAVAGIAPQNEMETMLAVQMVGTHELAMEMIDHANRANSLEKLDRYSTLATKMLRTFTA